MRINGDTDDEVDVHIESRTPILEHTNSIQQFSFLTVRHKAAYAVGHVLNDLCASMWFTYLLLYFNYVRVSLVNLLIIFVIINKALILKVINENFY